ncbi:MAG: ribonuclease HI family protein [Dehalococcoidia bacterium]|nr:ribonuclease HI family protein [Dehalococcoidia bacterium]
MPESVIIYTDGGCRYNPGPAAIGVLVQDTSGTKLAAISRYLGHGTNNQAEYHAVIAGLEKALSLGASRVEVRADSLLIVEQLNGRYKVKNAVLRPLFLKAQNLSQRFQSFSVKHIPREMNNEADRLANQALDAHTAERSGPGLNACQATLDL